jgi:trigger factor
MGPLHAEEEVCTVKVDISHPEKNVALLHIEVETERISQSRDSVYRRLVRRYNIPGFRKGKAPPLILQRYVGKDTFDKEVLDDLLDATYREALGESGLVPVSRPEVNLTTWEPGSALVYEAKLTTKPEVSLGQYTGIEIPREQPQVTDQQVDLEVELCRQRRVEFVDAPEGEPLAAGNVAVIDFAGFIGEEPVDGPTAQGYPLELGGGRFLAGFEEQLLGAKVGDQRDVRITFPQDAEPNLAGKEVTFKVTVKGYRLRRLPEVNDEFARAVAPSLGVKPDEGQAFGMTELRDELRRRLLAAAENRARNDFATKVIQEVVANASVDIPEVMIASRMASVREDFENSLKRRGMTLESYKDASGDTDEALQAGLRERAEAEVRRDLVLETVARKQDIAATDQEVDERISILARLYGQDPARLRGTLQSGDRIDGVREEIVSGKTIDYLVGVQTPVAAPPAEPPAAPGGTPSGENAPGKAAETPKPKRQRKTPKVAASAAAEAAAGATPAGTTPDGANQSLPSGVGIDQNQEEPAAPKRKRGARKGD